MDIGNFYNKDFESIEDDRFKVINALQNKGYFGFIWASLGLDIAFWFWSDIVFAENSFKAELIRILLKSKIVCKNIEIKSNNFELNITITL